MEYSNLKEIDAVIYSFPIHYILPKKLYVLKEVETRFQTQPNENKKLASQSVFYKDQLKMAPSVLVCGIMDGQI